MTDTNQDETTTGKVAPEKNSRKSPASQKWGAKVMDSGFCMLPSLLLRAQRRLHLNPTQLAVLIQIVDHWWDAGRKPYPSKKSAVPRAIIGLGALDQIAEEQVLLIGQANAAMQVVQQRRWIRKTGQSAVTGTHRGETALEI